MAPSSGTGSRLPLLLLRPTDFQLRRHKPIISPTGGRSQLTTQLQPASPLKRVTSVPTCSSKSVREPELSRTWSEYSSLEARGSCEFIRLRAACWVLLSRRVRRCSCISFELCLKEIKMDHVRYHTGRGDFRWRVHDVPVDHHNF